MAKRKKRTPSKGSADSKSRDEQQSDRMKGLREQFLGMFATASALGSGSTSDAKSGSKKKTAEQIVQETMPRKLVVKQSRKGSIPVADPDATSCDLASMRRKNKGVVRPDAIAADSASQIAVPSDDTGIVLVVPIVRSRDSVSDRAKAVVVTDGKVTGRQG